MRTAPIYNFLIEATIIASIAILLMLPIRRFLRGRLGSRAICFAWLLVAVRLLCPLSLPNPVIHEIQTPYNFDQENIRPIAGQVQVRVRDLLDDWEMTMLRQRITDRLSPEERTPITEAIEKDPVVRAAYRINASMWNGRMAHVLMAIYLAGAAGVTGWFVFSNIRFRRRLKRDSIEPLSGERLEQYQALCEQLRVKPLPVYLVDPLPGACLTGVIRPFIALPAAASPEEAEQMLRHELWHFRAHDPWWTLLQLVCCAVHWFNPLVWLAAALCRMDREMKCDENATRHMDADGKRAYASVLVRAAARKAAPGLPVLATGMSMTGKKLKLRVGSVLGGGRKLAALSVAFVVVSSLLLVCAFATSDTAQRINWEDGSDAGYTYKWTKYKGMDVSKQLLPDSESALKYAKTLWSGEYLNQELSQTRWNLSDYTGTSNIPFYGVEGYQPDGTWLHLNLLPDGAVDYLFVTLPQPENEAEDDAEPQPMPAEEAEKWQKWMLEAAEHLEPGVTDRMSRLVLNDVYDQDSGVTFVFGYLEMIQDDNRMIKLEVSPDLRLLEYGTGNG